MHRFAGFHRLLRVALVLLLFAAGACSERRLPSPQPARALGQQMHSEFAEFLARYHRGAGRLDYAAASLDPTALDRYLAFCSRVSPESDPQLFPREVDRLAYWINAYNAWAIRFVLDHYPIRSVNEVRTRFLNSLLPQGAAFFFFQPAQLGGRTINLYNLENGLIRKRFAEPRIHFALNCASESCPGLPREPFSPEGLEAELRRETQRFLQDPKNLRIDEQAGIVQLSAIFSWYERDFTSWVAEHRPDLPESLVGYVESQLGAGEAEALARCAECRVEFIDYDWSLSDLR